MSKKNLLLSLMALILLVSFFYVNSAVAFGLTTPFGGKVLATIPCTCQYTAWMMPTVVYVGPPRSGTFLKTVFTKTYSNYNVSIGNWVLGLAMSFKMPCMQTAGYACSTSGTYDFMYMVGTN